MVKNHVYNVFWPKYGKKGAAMFSFSFSVDGFAVPVPPPQNQEDPRSETFSNHNITDSNNFNVQSASPDIDVINFVIYIQ